MQIGKRMVMAGDFSLGSTGAALAYGLRQQGWDVLEIDSRAFLSQPRSLIGRSAARLMRPWSVRDYNAAINLQA